MKRALLSILAVLLMVSIAGAWTVGDPAASSSLPDQTGNSGKFLTTDGSTASWAATTSAIEIVYATGSPKTLSTSDVSYHIISNYGAAGSMTYNLPAAAADYAVGFVVGTAQNIVVDPNGTDVIILDGTALTAGNKFQNTAPAVGNFITCSTFKTGASSYKWICTTTSGTWSDGGA